LRDTGSIAFGTSELARKKCIEKRIEKHIEACNITGIELKRQITFPMTAEFGIAMRVVTTATFAASDSAVNAITASMAVTPGVD